MYKLNDPTTVDSRDIHEAVRCVQSILFRDYDGTVNPDKEHDADTIAAIVGVLSDIRLCPIDEDTIYTFRWHLDDDEDGNPPELSHGTVEDALGHMRYCAVTRVEFVRPDKTVAGYADKYGALVM